MNTLLAENNYILIDKFISPERAFELHTVFKEDTINYPNKFWVDDQCTKSLAIYNYHPFLELLVDSTPIMKDLVGEIMLPTYSYARQYKNGDVLEPHVDRGACEVSITLHLGSDGVEWPIYFKKPDNSVVCLKMQPGQAVVYLGCIAEHWRDTYEGDEYGQVFLHYVRSRGPNGIYYFDRVKD